MHHTFARNLFLCSLEGLHSSDAVQGFGCSQQVFCSAKMVFVYTNTLLAGAMEPLNMLPVFEKRTPVLGFFRGQASFDFCR